jgi:chemotaxis protein histidine kinase CheA
MCGEAVNAARQCETCKQIEKIKKAESKRVETLRRQQAEKKANADKKRAEAEVEQAEIHRRIKALEFEREAVLKQTLAEIETMKLKQELELNEKQQFADTVFQAAEAREAAGVAMEAEQRRAEAEAERKTEEARKKLEELHKKSKSSANGLSELEKQTAASLMNLELEVKKTTKLSVHNSEAATQDNAKYSLRKQVFLAASSGDALQVHAVLAEFARGGNLKPALGFLDDERFLDIVVSLALVPFNHDGHISDLPQLEECIRLVNKRDFFSASKILQSLEGGHGSSGMTAIRALSAICLVKLGSLNDDEGLVGLGDSDSPLPSDQLASPLWLLAKSLCAQKLKNKKRAYLLALAAVMHPALSLMPVCAQEALEIICINNGTFDSGSAKVNEEGEFNRRAGQSRALRKLLNLTGCKSVKEKLLDLKDRCSLSNERGDDLTNTQLNAVFTGNPGKVVGQTVLMVSQTPYY